ncbi:hypothetical protein HDE_03319 [Halotydeus destructor]|nr:hypothetical protein HDE_03319 [Halotydeus destructor]
MSVCSNSQKENVHLKVMASSTSVEGEVNLVARQPQHKSMNRARQQRAAQRNKSEQHSAARDRTMSASGTLPAQLVDVSGDKHLGKSPSSKNGRHNKRNLREKRRATGVFHSPIFSTESTGGTSSGTDDDLDSDATSRQNMHLNEVIPASSSGKQDEQIESQEQLRISNQYLKEQIRIKDAYIQQLEEQIEELKLSNKGPEDDK